MPPIEAVPHSDSMAAVSAPVPMPGVRFGRPRTILGFGGHGQRSHLNLLSFVSFLLLIVVAVDAKDLYKVLGVDKNATERDIKNAFHKQSLKYHPDKNKAKNAQSKFEEISHGMIDVPQFLNENLMLFRVAGEASMEGKVTASKEIALIAFEGRHLLQHLVHPFAGVSLRTGSRAFPVSGHGAQAEASVYGVMCIFISRRGNMVDAFRTHIMQTRDLGTWPVRRMT